MSDIGFCEVALIMNAARKLRQYELKRTQLLKCGSNKELHRYSIFKYLCVINNGNRSAQTKGQWGTSECPNQLVCMWMRWRRCRQQFCRNKHEEKDLIRALTEVEKQETGGYSTGT